MIKRNNGKKESLFVFVTALLAMAALFFFPTLFSFFSLTGATVASSCTMPSQRSLLLFGSGDNYLYALDATTGTLLWKSDATRDIEYGAPAVSDGKVYIGTRNRLVQAFALETGTLLWKTKVNGRVYGTPVAYENKVFVGVGNGIIYALHADTGEILWQFATGTEEKASDIYSSLAFSHGVLYASAYDGKVYAIDTQGTLLWTFATEGKLYASVRIEGDAAYVASNDGNVYALDAKTGKRLWKAPLPSPSGEISSLRTTPAYYENRLYVAAYNGVITALDTSSVEVLWQTDLETIIPWSSPFVTEDMLYIGAYDGKIYALARETGEIIWSFQTDGRIYSSPLVFEGVLYVGSGDYHFYALDAITGELLWKYKTGSSINGAATIVYTS